MISRVRAITIAGSIFFIFFTLIQAQAATVEYELIITEQELNISGRQTSGMTINGAIPGPTLIFKEGDFARIHVKNMMAVETSIHWHGLLVPTEMDGVPNISFPPIEPGKTFTYEFPIRQNGTYWYHSHTNLQEQRGLYGAIVINPRQDNLKPDHDHVILLSDWTDDDPHEVLRTLKRGSEWYALEKGSAQSIIGAFRSGRLGDYYKRELQRMPPMDIADVAYDRFLANGKPELTLPAKADETVRLRIVNGSATTYFHVEFTGQPMTIIAADGQNIVPVQNQRLLIGVAETYDLLIKIPPAGAYEFKATAHDGSGYASVWIGSGKHHPAPEVPKPNLYHIMGHFNPKQIFSLTPAGAMGMSDHDVKSGKYDQPGMMHMGSTDMQNMNGMGNMKDVHNMQSMTNMNHNTGHTKIKISSMDHSKHSMPVIPQISQSGKKYGTNFGFLSADVSSAPNLAIDGIDPGRPWAPYDKLRAPRPTNFSKDKIVREIRLTLDGDMERYVWFLNQKPLSESDSISIDKGEVVRFIMINRTMMHHPMHLHGHFFRVINGQGDNAPLKHTVDVAPMSTTVIEFAADEFGDWFFHCHLLYHMKSGMARVVHYTDFALNPQLAAIRSNLYKDSWYIWGQADALSNMTEGFLRCSNSRNILTADWEVGWQEVDKTEWETLVTWDRYINRFFTIFAGANLLGVSNNLDDTRAVLGIHYLLPLNLESRAWIDSDGGARLNLTKSLVLTPRFELHGEVQYDTHDHWEGRAGLSYMVYKNLSLIAQWDSDYGFGGGLQLSF